MSTRSIFLNRKFDDDVDVVRHWTRVAQRVIHDELPEGQPSIDDDNYYRLLGQLVIALAIDNGAAEIQSQLDTNSM